MKVRIYSHGDIVDRDIFKAVETRWHYNNILQKIQTVADYGPKDKPSLSNKVIFKHMDIIDILK